MAKKTAAAKPSANGRRRKSKLTSAIPLVAESRRSVKIEDGEAETATERFSREEILLLTDKGEFPTTFYRRQWDASKVPERLHGNLCGIDRAVAACASLSELLKADCADRNYAEACAVSYTPLSTGIACGLHEALDLLLFDMQERLEWIRETSYAAEEGEPQP